MNTLLHRTPSPLNDDRGHLGGQAQETRFLPACKMAGISLRPYRHLTKSGKVEADGLPTTVCLPLVQRLKEGERGEVLRVCSKPCFSSLPPSQIVSRLAD